MALDFSSSQLRIAYQGHTTRSHSKMVSAFRALDTGDLELAAKYTREAVVALEKASDAQMDLLHHIMKEKKKQRIEGDLDAF